MTNSSRWDDSYNSRQVRQVMYGGEYILESAKKQEFVN